MYGYNFCYEFSSSVSPCLGNILPVSPRFWPLSALRRTHLASAWVWAALVSPRFRVFRLASDSPRFGLSLSCLGLASVSGLLLRSLLCDWKSVLTISQLFADESLSPRWKKDHTISFSVFSYFIVVRLVLLSFWMFCVPIAFKLCFYFGNTLLPFIWLYSHLLDYFHKLFSISFLYLRPVTIISQEITLGLN